MTKKKQGMDEDALGGLFDSIDLVYEDDLPEAQAEESQAQATDAAPAVPAAVAEEVAEGTNEAPSEEASGETPDETSEEEAEKTPRLRMKRTKRPGKLRRGRGSIPSAPP